MQNKVLRFLAICTIAVGFGVCSIAWAQTITTFDAPNAGTGPGQGTLPSQNTEQGAIVGFYIDSSNVNHGFLRAPGGTFISFDVPGAGTGPNQGTIAYGISQNGAITGFYIDSSNIRHGFLRFKDGTFATFSASAKNTNALSINPSGFIAGYYRASVGALRHGFVRAPDGTITSFDPPDSVFTVGDGINPSGTISGYWLDANNLVHGFVRSNDGAITTFDAPGAGTDGSQGQGTVPENINQTGAIPGYYVDSNNMYHGFLRAPDGAFTSFDAPGAGPVVGYAVNPAGAITGYYLDESNLNHGFVRAPDGTFSTIDAPGAGTDGSQGQGTIPVSITPAGAITGYYFDGNNVAHGFVRK